MPALTPITSLVELDVKCDSPGTYTVVLSAARQDPFGAFYGDVDAQLILVKTVPYAGANVAGTHQITCLDPNVDTDQDGCTNGQELGTNKAHGGLRDPLNFSDFFDTPTGTWPNLARDKQVSGMDLVQIAGRKGSSGNPNIDALSTPPASPAYHTAYDRGPTIGPNSWNLTAANGSIAATDFFTVLAQFGDSCA